MEDLCDTFYDEAHTFEITEAKIRKIVAEKISKLNDRHQNIS